MFNFSLFSVTGQGIDLDYCDIEWFALEMNRDHYVIFDIASKYYISESFVDYDGYSISSKGFLLTVVNIMLVLAWRIPGMEEPGGLPSVGSHRVGHDWSDLAAALYLYV